jgi:hypothetical protein
MQESVRNLRAKRAFSDYGIWGDKGNGFEMIWLMKRLLALFSTDEQAHHHKI